MSTHPQGSDHPPRQDTAPPREDLPQPERPEQAEARQPGMRQAQEPGPDAATGPQVVQDEQAARLRELEDRWRRALADLDNLRKRHTRELERERLVERSRVAAAMLPVVDNLERALEHAGADPDAVLDGVKAIRNLAVETLERLGYPRHDETGVRFDPTWHEVVGVVEDPEAEPGTVVQVLRPGYGDPPDRQLRPVAVAVAKRE